MFMQVPDNGTHTKDNLFVGFFNLGNYWVKPHLTNKSLTF